MLRNIKEWLSPDLEALRLLLAIRPEWFSGLDLRDAIRDALARPASSLRLPRLESDELREAA